MRDIDVLNHLVTDTDITDIIADRIWTTWVPEKTELPAITCNYVADNPINTFAGDTLKSRQVVSINCWANDKQTVINMINAVMTKMAAFAVRLSMTELNEEEQGIYRYSIDYSVFG